ncbi:hypothetical protein BGZ58_010498 [Dissophora ornata]|nr:hypothetical protein BGZ58_010498 [Dissophora ornata]
MSTFKSIGADTEREIAEAKERIKQQRQLQVAKEIHHRQSVQIVKVLQEYDTLLRQYQPNTLKSTTWFQENDSDHYALRATIEKVLREVSRTIELVTINGVTFQQDQVAHGRCAQDLYQALQQGHDDATYFFGVMKELKEGNLSSLQSQRQEQIQQSENKDTASKATKLLQLFQDHHGERVDRIDMVLNQISVCEQEMEELYSKMRFQAQRWENEKNPALFQQGLEETKAHLRGLETALEFIQAEQENLVERVASMDEQQAHLEAMIKASRAADKKVTDVQRVVRKFIEMIKINSQGVPRTAEKTSQDITRSISEDLSQLSDLVQDRTYTLEGDSKVMQGLSEQSQKAYAETHTKVLQAPVLDWRESDLANEQQTNGQNPWREITTKSSISADQHILQLVGLQRHNAVQRLALSNAKELSQIMERIKTETTSMMKTFVRALPEESQVHGDDEKERGVSVSNLTSKFEGDVKDVTRSIVQFEKDHHAAFQSDIQDIGAGLEVGEEIVYKVGSLVDDSDRIAEHFLLDQNMSSKPFNSKRMRYIQ